LSNAFKSEWAPEKFPIILRMKKRTHIKKIAIVQGEIGEIGKIPKSDTDSFSIILLYLLQNNKKNTWKFSDNWIVC